MDNCTVQSGAWTGDLDPLATDQLQAIDTLEERLDFGCPESLSVERDLEILEREIGLRKFGATRDIEIVPKPQQHGGR